MTQYACWQCTDPLPDGDTWCDTCGGNTLAVEVLEPATIRDDQRTAICHTFKSWGEVNKAKRMARLSAIIGRSVHDYGNLTEAEADLALKELANGSA